MARIIGTKGKEKKVILYNDRMIAKYYLKGFAQEVIADKLDITQPEVSTRLEDIRKRWRDSTLIDFHERQGAELEKVDKLEEEYLNLYEESKEKTLRVVTKKIPYMQQEGMAVTPEGQLVTINGIQYQVVEVVEEVKHSKGDKSILDSIHKCVETRLKILGLYAQPTQKFGASEIPVGQGISISNETTKSKVTLFLGLIEEWHATSTDN